MEYCVTHTQAASAVSPRLRDTETTRSIWSLACRDAKDGAQTERLPQEVLARPESHVVGTTVASE